MQAMLIIRGKYCISLGEKHTLMRFKAVEIGIHLKGKTVIVDKYPTV